MVSCQDAPWRGGQVFVPIEDSVKAKDCDVGTPNGSVEGRCGAEVV